MAFPSTYADIKTSVYNNVRLDSTLDATKVADWINQIYAQVCVEAEANITSATMTMTANAASYTLPSGILRIKEMYVTPVGSTQTTPLTQIPLDKILSWRSASAGSTTSGGATHYALLGLTELEVWPTPASADVITVYYVALPTALSGASDVAILQEPYVSDVLIYGASTRAAEFKKDPDAAYYRQLYTDSLRRFRAHLTRRQGNVTTQFEVRGQRSVVAHDPSTDSR